MPEIEALLRTERGVRAAERLTRATERNIRAMERWQRRMERGERQVRRMGRAARGAETQLLGFISAFGGLQAARTVTAAIDQYANARNRLIAIGVAADRTAGQLRNLQQVADEQRTTFDTTTTIYQRFARAAQDLGRDQNQVLRITRAVAATARLSGATTQERQNALVQLTQGLGPGGLRGDEFRSIREQLPTVLNVIARQLGVSVLHLRQLSQQGKLTGDVILDSFLNANEELERSAQLPTTISESFVLLSNATTQLGADLQSLNSVFADTVGFLAGGVRNLANWTGELTLAENAARSLTIAIGTAATVGAFSLVGGFATLGALFTSPVFAFASGVGILAFITGLETNTGRAAEAWSDLAREVNATANAFGRAAASGTAATAAVQLQQRIRAAQAVRARILQEGPRGGQVPLSAIPGGLSNPALLIRAAENLRGRLGLQEIAGGGLNANQREQQQILRRLLTGDRDPLAIAASLPGSALTVGRGTALGAVDTELARLQAQAEGFGGGGGAGIPVVNAAADRFRTNIARAIIDPLRQALVDEDWDDVGRQIVVNLQQAVLEASVFEPAQDFIKGFLKSLTTQQTQSQQNQEQSSEPQNFVEVEPPI